ncbi:methionine ABC transporter ATP-binding protein [Alcaligenes sp. WGS1538]|uniref:methionine ABC transporter ATP-binding protein n=1 Tax=Alcaligenes sp. WGS1538 TaxID=3366811 RepID=UPI00372D3A9D
MSAALNPALALPRGDTNALDVALAPARGAGSVSFEQIDKIYASANGPVHALKDINLDIPAGSIYGIIGRSGAGKSSLLRTINRLETPTRGRVRVDGVDIGRLNEAQLVALRRRIGMIFQHFNLLSAKTVWENIALPLQVANVPRADIAARVDELLGLVGLQDKRDSYPSRLSGGQKQRVGIARALVHHPEILLCDEATSALDPETTHAILQLLRGINQRLGITIVLITHEMSVIRAIADQVLVLERGEIAEHGEVWKIFGNPRHPATRALLAPLQHDLPPDLRQALRSEAPAAGGERLLQLSYNGRDRLEPDLLALAQALQAPLRLVHGGVDRIQGHAHGRLIVAVPAHAALPPLRALTEQPGALAHGIEDLGYVPTH